MVENINFKSSLFPTLNESFMQKEHEKFLEEAKKSKLKEKYESYFKEKLKEYGCSSLKEMDKDKKSKFFKELKDGWTKEKEKYSKNEAFSDLSSISGVPSESSPDFSSELSGLNSPAKVKELLDRAKNIERTVAKYKPASFAEDPEGFSDVMSKLQKNISDMEKLAAAAASQNYGKGPEGKSSSGLKDPSVSSPKLKAPSISMKEAFELLKESKKITTPGEFREYAMKLLKKAHGDDFDEEKAKETVEGILSKAGEDMGTAVGMIQSSL